MGVVDLHASGVGHGCLASRGRILPRIYLIFGKKGADVNVKNAIDISERRGEVRGGVGRLSSGSAPEPHAATSAWVRQA